MTQDNVLEAVEQRFAIPFQFVPLAIGGAALDQFGVPLRQEDIAAVRKTDAALLGGSFAPLGGQNLIEVAACGCPLLMGPHTFNFADAAERSIAAGAALRVADIDEAVARAVALAHNPARNDWVQRAFAFAAAHRGAAQRMASEVLSVTGRR